MPHFIDATDRGIVRRRVLSPFLLGAGVLLAGYALLVHGSAFALAFVNDDYLILDRVLRRGFVDLWRPEGHLFGWYRPWSREFHYWVLAGMFGLDAPKFHLGNFLLWLGVLALYFQYVRRIAGSPAAATATTGLATLALWSTPLLWVAGVQDLWMLLFALLFLHAMASGRPFLAAPCLVLALLSKETAAVLPGIAFASLVLADQIPIRRAARQVAAFVGTVAAWALAHPTLRERFFGSLRSSLESDDRPSPGRLVLRTLAAQANLDLPFAPEVGWESVALRGLFAGVLIAVCFLLLRRSDARGSQAAPAGPPGGRLVGFGIAWTILGWLVLVLPSIGWHAYYGVLGSLGVWLVIGVALRRHPRPFVVALCALCILGEAKASTPSWDWGTAWYHRRAGRMLEAIHDRVKGFYPDLPAHSRVYFANIPNNIGLIAADGPAIRIWYDDPTLEGRFYSAYTLRAPVDSSGRDYFFRFDSTYVLVEVVAGTAEPIASRGRPGWRRDHKVLASLFIYAGNTLGAAEEYEKLWQDMPGKGEFALYAATAFDAAGDSARAGPLYARARESLGEEFVLSRAPALVQEARTWRLHREEIVTPESKVGPPEKTDPGG